MDPQVVALLIALALKLAPAAEEALAKALALLVALIPDPPGSDKAFLATCIRIVQGIRHDDPDFTMAEQRTTAIAAIRQLAADQGRILDTAILTTLGLQTP